MISVDSLDRTSIKTDRKIWRQLGKIKKQKKSLPDNTKQFRISQSVKAGHIRGGHAFH